MLLPQPEFWRIWGVALALAAVLIAAFLHMPAGAEPMRASFYGAESGRRTASGLPFDPLGLTAAHRSLPFGMRLRVCLAACAVVTVTDRGPAAWTGRSLDLSRGAARLIGLERRGVATVTVEQLN